MASKRDENLTKPITTIGKSAFPGHGPESPRDAINEIVTRRRVDELSVSQPTVKVENVREVSSYSWMNSPEPKIAMPGLPPRWTPPRVPPLLSQDSGSYFRDQNSAHYPKHPMEPAIRSVLSAQVSAEAATKSASEVHIFACGSTLGSLLRFALGRPTAFCFRVHIVGKTAFFIRKEKTPRQLIEGPIWGYGHTFPEAYTTWDPEVSKSDSHQKIIRYSFGGKDMMVRFEADGYLPEKAPRKPISKSKPPPSSATNDPGSLTSLLSELQTTRNPTTTLTKSTLDDPSLSITITRAGHGIPQSSIFDLKTRSWKKALIDVVGEELPRLWINQIPNFVLAFHRQGVFSDVRVQDVRGRVATWQAAQSNELRAYSGLLDFICETAARAEGMRCEVSWVVGAEGIKVKSVGDEEWAVMPEGLKEEWVGGAGDE